MDEARVIPMHGQLATRARAAGRVAVRRAARPLPGPGRVVALTSETPLTSPTQVDQIPSGRVSWEHRVGGALEFLRRRAVGRYEVDEFGFDRDLAEHVLLPAIEPLYRRWFRVDVSGIENLPRDGGALLVANHSGGLWPVDMAITAAAVRIEHPAGRFLRVLADDSLFRLPGAAAITRKAGGAVACDDDAARLLAAGELVGTWPEGLDGLGKPFGLRYRLQRFDHNAFAAAALRAGVPVIPVAIVGAEEAYPVLGEAWTLARALGLPHLPVTPTFPLLGPLGLVPLPSKWHIEFGAPIPAQALGADAADDPAAVFELADQVRATVQDSVYRLLAGRRSVWR